MRHIIVALMTGLFLCTAPLLYANAQPSMSEEEIQDRSKAIQKTLRCVVCQNQSIADSDSPLAEDMRDLVERRVRLGERDEEVRDYMQDRYGDFILMRPPFKPYTMLLWFGPFALLVIGGFWYFQTVRRRKSTPEPNISLTQAEAEKLKAIMKEAKP